MLSMTACSGYRSRRRDRLVDVRVHERLLELGDGRAKERRVPLERTCGALLDAGHRKECNQVSGWDRPYGQNQILADGLDADVLPGLGALVGPRLPELTLDPHLPERVAAHGDGSHAPTSASVPVCGLRRFAYQRPNADLREVDDQCGEDRHQAPGRGQEEDRRENREQDEHAFRNATPRGAAATVSRSRVARPSTSSALSSTSSAPASLAATAKRRRVVAGDGDQAEARTVAAQAGDGADAVEERHVQVDHDRVRLLRLDALERRDAVRDRAGDVQLGLARRRARRARRGTARRRPPGAR